MKRLLSYLGFVFLFIACSKLSEPVVKPQPLPFAFSDDLLRIDSLMQRDADSALMMLTSFRPTEGSGDISSNYNDNYQSLLLSEALYKTDNAQLNRFVGVETCHGASLHNAMHFFDSLYVLYPLSDDLAVLSARAHYMNGVGYYENDSVVDACKEYLHTLEIMENHFDESELVGYKAKFMGLTYTRLGETFYYTWIDNASLESYQNALHYFSKVPDYSLANTYRHIAGSYYLYKQNDSAMLYYRKALQAAKSRNQSLLYGGILSETAPVYYDLGFVDSAFIVIKKALSLPSSDDARLAQYYTFGSLYAKEHLYDSAIYYLKKSLNRSFYATQTASAELLMKCYQDIGDSVMSQKYKSIYDSYFTQYRNIDDIKTELTKIYNDYISEQQQQKSMLLIKPSTQRNFSFLLLFFVVITVVVLCFIIKSKIIKNRIWIKDMELAEIKRKMEINGFTNEPICHVILEITNANSFKSKINYEHYKKFALNKDQLLTLRDAVNRHYNNFTQRIYQIYPKLTYDDIDYCCLYLLGLKDADVSALMQRSYRAVCDRNKKLRIIFGIDYSISIFLNKLANNRVFE